MKGNVWAHQYLVQWQFLPLEEATWVDQENFHQLYPAFHLEDKVTFEGQGIVTSVMERKEDNYKMIWKVGKIAA